MCIALFKPSQVILTKKLLKTCFENNPHGAGMAYPSNDKTKVIINKGYFGFREFWKKFQQIQLNRPMLIHFRVATSGIIDKKNCHPWRIDERHALVHNGVIANKIGLDSDEFSDTGLFVKHLLVPAFSKNDNFWKTDAWKWTFEKAVGDKNKFAIIDNNGNVVIYNEKEGEWDKQCWFSNDTYKNPRKSLATLGNQWFEKVNGKVRMARRKAGKIIYTYVDNPLSEIEDTKKIVGFALNQLKCAQKDEMTITDENENEVDVTAMI